MRDMQAIELPDYRLTRARRIGDEYHRFPLRARTHQSVSGARK
jgi:hypothetical protein